VPVPRLAPLLAPLLVATLLTAACGGDDDADDAPEATTETPTGDGGSTGADGAAGATGSGSDDGEPGACGRLTSGGVSDLFGEPATAVPGPTEATCLWEATSGSSDAPVRHQLQLAIYPEGGVDPTAYGPDVEPIDDLGDEAFVVPDGTLGTTAGYSVDGEAVVLTYAVVGDGGPDPAERADGVVDLLRTVAED
jgi:hypothetical protein